MPLFKFMQQRPKTHDGGVQKGTVGFYQQGCSRAATCAAREPKISQHCTISAVTKTISRCVW